MTDDSKRTVDTSEGEKWKNPGEYFSTIEGRRVVHIEPMVGGRERMKLVAKFEMTQDDVMAVSSQKSGTHWLNEIIYLIMSDADLVGMKTTPASSRVTLTDVYLPNSLQLEDIQSRPHPWLLQTHLYAENWKRSLYETKGKFVVILRNPKDVLVSYFHFLKAMPFFRYPHDWDRFFAEVYKTDRVIYGNSLYRCVSWWRLRHLDNVHIVMYEDLKRNPTTMIANMARFLGKDLPDETVHTIVEATTFSKMKETIIEDPDLVGKEGQGSVLRKGEIGDWKNYFSAEQSKYVDDMCEALAVPEGLEFTFE